MKEPHTALFVAPTGVGKTHLALNLLENEYRNHFNFIVIICPIRINFYLYIRMKRYLTLLKMAEDIFSGYDTQSDSKHKKLLECVLTRNSKLYLGKVYTEEQLKKT